MCVMCSHNDAFCEHMTASDSAEVKMKTEKLNPNPPPQITHPYCAFDLFCIKKGTIYITFIKSFSIIKYNITLLQKFQIPATIQDKLPKSSHRFILFHFFFQTTSSPSCANNFYKTRLIFFFFFCTVNNQVSIRVPASAKKRRP